MAALAVVAAGALTLAAVLYLHLPGAPADPPTIRFSIPSPEGWSTLTSGALRPLAMSPDGRSLAFVAADKNGRTMLWLRSLDTVTARVLNGTDGAGAPFWSPDSRFLAFVADGKLKKIDVSGGPPQTLADAATVRGGGSWSREDVIVFNASGNGPLSRVSAMGGPVAPVTTLGAGDVRHMHPAFLPDGQHFLYSNFAGGFSLNIGAVNSKEQKVLLRDGGDDPQYAQGRVFYVRGGTLMAQAFDAGRLELVGNPSPVAQIHRAGEFSVSPGGVIAYQAGSDLDRSRLTWVDRSGRPARTFGEPAHYYTVEISPDGKRAAGSILDQFADTVNGDVWLYDLTGDGRTKLTFDPQKTVGRGVWSPDGARVVFAAARNGKSNLDLFQKASSGAGGEEPILQDGINKIPLSWSSDGRFLLYVAAPGSPTTGNDLWVLPLFGDRKPFPFLQTRFAEYPAQFSPDGRSVAYVSNESGRGEVYVAAFPGANGKRQISTAGGNFPRWRRDGKEIFWLAPDDMLMAASVIGEGPGVQVTGIKALFATRHLPSDFPYDVAADGQGFLVISVPDDASASDITVVVNWRPKP